MARNGGRGGGAYIISPWIDAWKVLMTGAETRPASDSKIDVERCAGVYKKRLVEFAHLTCQWMARAMLLMICHPKGWSILKSFLVASPSVQDERVLRNFHGPSLESSERGRVDGVGGAFPLLSFLFSVVWSVLGFGPLFLRLSLDLQSNKRPKTYFCNLALCDRQPQFRTTTSVNCNMNLWRHGCVPLRYYNPKLALRNEAPLLKQLPCAPRWSSLTYGLDLVRFRCYLKKRRGRIFLLILFQTRFMEPLMSCNQACITLDDNSRTEALTRKDFRRSKSVLWSPEQ